MASANEYKHLKLGTTKTWIMISKVDNARGLIVLPNGSGEYRSVFQGDDYDEQTAWLNRNGYNVVKYDKYGCGESSGNFASVTMNKLVNQLVELSSTLKLEYDLPLIIMGHSEGSIIAAEAAALSRDIQAVILRVASHQDILERIKFQLNNSDKTGKSYEHWLSGIDEIKQTLKDGKEVSGFLSSHPRTYWASRLNRKLTGDVIKDINIPVFALNGGKDYYTPEHCFLRIHEVLKKHHQLSQAKVYEGVGHSLRENGENYGEAKADLDIIDWLKEVINGHQSN